MGFALKKIVSPFFLPFAWCIAFILLGIGFLFFGKRKRLGLLLALSATLILYALSTPFVSSHLLRPLESLYPPLKISSPASARTDIDPSRIRWIVVLGGGHVWDTEVPMTSRVSRETMIRLMEAVRLFRNLPGSRLLLSGGTYLEEESDAEVMAILAEAMGVPRQILLLEKDSKDTFAQARLIRPIVRSDPFILVTSASHMPRSMAVFRKSGMNPVAAPTDFRILRTKSPFHTKFLPAAAHLRNSEGAVYEYLGLVWYRLTGKI
ncbi:MAG TPA: ElyC/SanA/YdcF family protein [Syntrophales bacterium]|nr:ElyC/SanA/YdcF family protein [Syntrophales bacterium]